MAPVSSDPDRPIYHLMPAEGLCHDPCAAICWRGRYHLFFLHGSWAAGCRQLRADGGRQLRADGYEYKAWAHVSSPDLIRWHRHPDAVERGQTGDLFLWNGTPTIIYPDPGRKGAACIASNPERDLERWVKHPANPVLTDPWPDDPDPSGTRRGGADQQFPRVQEAPISFRQGEPIRLRVFLDRSVLELFVGDQRYLAQRIYPTRADSVSVRLFSRGGPAVVRRLRAWQMAGLGMEWAQGPEWAGSATDCWGHRLQGPVGGRAGDLNRKERGPWLIPEAYRLVCGRSRSRRHASRALPIEGAHSRSGSTPC